MQLKVFKGFWSIEDSKKYSKYIFLFGDNNQRSGMGGQAIIRGASNSLGIRTKNSPNMSDDAFWTDNTFQQNKKFITEDFNLLYKKLEKENWDGVIISENGLGTGLAELDQRAPETFNFLQNKLEELKIYLMSEKELKEYISDKDNLFLTKITDFLSDIYHNTDDFYQPVISDEKYDIISDKLSEKDKKIGAKPKMSENIVSLPYYLGGTDKITPEEEKKLKRWIENAQTETFVITEKLDGVSCLFVKKNGNISLFTRGDGILGTDISFLKDYITLPKIDIENIAVRGELIIKKNIFTSKYTDTYKNARNMVAGLISSKIKSSALQDVDYVVYEIVDDFLNIKKQSPEKQLDILQQIGFNIPIFKICSISEICSDFLTETLINFKSNSKYNLDGIVVQINKEYTRNRSGNPNYLFAYKITGELYQTEVLEIEWQISKSGKIKPVVVFVPVVIDGVTISRATANHAKYVIDNGLGAGAIIKITRSKDVIPYIYSVEKRSEKILLPNEPYIWDENGVNIIFAGKNTGQICKKIIYSFFKGVGIKDIGEQTINKLYDKGLDTVLKIVFAEKEDIKKLQIDGFGEKTISNIIDNIKKGLQNITIHKLLGVSGIFGEGIGELKVKLLLDNIPDILYSNIPENKLIENIQNIHGFSNKSAIKIADNLKFAKLFLEKIKPKISLKQIPEKQEKENIFQNKIFVFTGFRDEDLKNFIENMGGKVTNCITNKTTDLIKNGDKVTNKINQALDNNINIHDYTQFLKKYNL